MAENNIQQEDTAKIEVLKKRPNLWPKQRKEYTIASEPLTLR